MTECGEQKYYSHGRKVGQQVNIRVIRTAPLKVKSQSSMRKANSIVLGRDRATYDCPWLTTSSGIFTPKSDRATY
jgi:hypothetical protein